MECLGDGLFWDTVEGTRRLIEEDNPWIFEHDFCDGETLFLSTWEFNSFFSDLRFESLFKIENKFTFRIFDNLIQLLLSWFVIKCIREIFHDTSVKNRWFLSEVSDMAIVGFERNLREALSIDNNLSAIRPNVSGYELDERTLSSSTRSYKGIFFSSVEFEWEVLENTSSSVIGKRNILKNNFSGFINKFWGIEIFCISWDRFEGIYKFFDMCIIQKDVSEIRSHIPRILS
ncbi:MAG: hypothetical protein ACD_71C00138G0001 [uncultured bacterium (gcode 4)]|uniref:Uncharacterized protein n=1 Tax=uncultured bacterium (gcode 4) TaxID=1234023 RepID=K1Z4E0_9BACT|nr:MAG: hypothetical protein ACD_71C00138G0001 [uncultured bacterium (gcode 4)]